MDIKQGNTLNWDNIPNGSIHCDNIRDYITIKNRFVITPPEEKLNIFSVTEKKIKPWTSKVTLPPYESLSKVYLDIETTKIPNGVDDVRYIARKIQIKMIGIRNEKGKNILIHSESESQMLSDFFKIMYKKKPDILITFNGTNFDLPILHHRADLLGLSSPFRINYDTRESRFGAAEIAGRQKDVWFRPVYCQFGGKKCPHLDLYQSAIAYDSILRKFTKYSLKSIPLQLGLREDDRLELTVNELEDCYRRGDWETVGQYLEDDLEDTERLGNFFSKAIHYQQVYFPKFNIQQLNTVGNATKWNSNLTDYYGTEYVDSLPEPKIYNFQGALTHTISGVHVDVAGCDFSGQYPSSMLQYGIHSIHDKDAYMLGVMAQAVKYREAIKYKENITQEEKDLTTAIKPLVNSAYGSLAAYIPFGDSVAAATVTLFARARIKWAIKFVENMGGKVVLTDTDSIYLITDKTDIHKKHPISEGTLKKLPPNPSDKLLSAVAIVEQLKANIPSGAKLDLEAVNRILFVPPEQTPKDFEKSYRFDSSLGRKYVQKTLSNEPKVYQFALDNFANESITFKRLVQISRKFNLDFPNFGSIKKNYIKIEWDAKKQDWKVSGKGKFVKRDVIPFEKEFQKNFLFLYADSPTKAKQYYNLELSKLVSGSYDKSKLTTTRKIRKGEVNLINLGFGEHGDTVSFYRGVNGIPTKSGDYDISYYVQRLTTLHQEMTCFLDELKVEEYENEVKQLALF